MSKAAVVLVSMALSACVLAENGLDDPTPTPSSTPTATPTPTPVGSEGIHVDLTWDIDTTDVDLHLVYVTGTGGAPGAFYVPPYDCFYQNKTPEWGGPGLADNPALLADTVDGFGPETIAVPEPANGTYRIYAHYYSDDGLGPTTATIALHMLGIAAGEWTFELVATDKVWDVATIDWPSQQVSYIGTVFDRQYPNP